MRNRYRTWLLVPALFAASLGAASCGKDSPRVAKEVRPVPGGGEFALELYSKLAAEEDGNLFFSPLSIRAALAMTYAGARGDTANEMAEVLRFSLAQEKLHPAMGRMLGALAAAKDCEVSIANSLWGHESYPFRAGFVDLLGAEYGAPLTKVDFVGAPEAARKRINDWVGERTRGRIRNILTPGSINRDVRLVLVNAIYFFGKWALKFDKRGTQDAPFHLAGGGEVQVKMMCRWGEYRYFAGNGFQGLAIPYRGGELEMLVLLPAKPGGVGGLGRSLGDGKLREVTKGLRKQEVVLYLPKFELTCAFELNGVLKKMGMVKAFDPAAADLTGMTDEAALKEMLPLFVSKALHKAFVRTDEEGTEAAAATAVIAEPVAVEERPEPVVFRCDRPFIFLIGTRRTGSILFMGRVMNPGE